MKKVLLPILVAAVASVAAAGIAAAKSPKTAKAKESPVLMTVAGKPVTLDEFEYLYHKNNAQQAAPQSVDEYLDMFITYKQKVAAAEAAGIDQTEAFATEFDGYRRDLAEPYLTDQAVTDSILAALYERMKTERDVSHIMVPLRTPANNPEAQRAFLDSLRTAIVGGADFGAVARQYSSDRAAQRNSGHMGWLPVTRTPYTFEDAAYQTPVGEISPVVATPFGFHIVKVNAERPARGQVLVEHILKLTQGLSPEEAAVKKAQIDSIYAVVTAPGADFEAVAKAESEDPGSAQAGGKLPWFGTGQMVSEFETVSYDLPNGAISEPFPTSYGYHIVHKLDSKAVPAYDEALPALKKAIANDERGKMGRVRRLQQLERQFAGQQMPQALDPVRQQIARAGSIDSSLLASLAASDLVVGRVNDHDITLAEAMEGFKPNVQAPTDMQVAMVEQAVARAYENALLDCAREDLALTNPEYRNLLNEYRDGILLFEISDREVWSRAKKEPEELARYFDQHRGEYTWQQPRFKGFVVFAATDSVGELADKYLNDHHVGADSVATVLRSRFGKDVKATPVLAHKGENPIVDYLAFSGEKPEKAGRWAVYFPYLGRVISAPEEVSDERGAVTTDFQNALEQQWLQTLRQLYPAKVNKKVLKKAK